MKYFEKSFYRNIFFSLFLVSFLIVVLTPHVWAEEIADEIPLVSSFFFETDIREAINEITFITGVNILYDQSVRGSITLDLQDIPLEKALDMMFLTGGYVYQKIDDFYLVTLPDQRSPNFKSLSTSEVYFLNYTTSAEVVSLLPPYYKDYVQRSSRRDNIITITAPEQVVEEIKDYIKMIDIPEKEVLIQVHVTEISTELLQERGGDLLGFIKADAALPQDNYYRMLYERAGFKYLFERDFGSLEGRLKFLAQTEDVSIEANPRILVNDRATANLFIGEEQVIFLEPANAPARLERVNVGVDVRVTPQIINDEIIRLRINPDLSHFSEERQDRLVVKRSELDTTVFAKNGEALTLAGMTMSRETEFTSAVPVLGNIPLLRWFFREETERKSERELIIFLTAEIVGK